HRDRRDVLSAQRRYEVLRLELVRAEAMQRRGGHVGLDRDAHRDAGVVAARELLEEDRVVRVVEPLAAVGGIEADAEQAERAHLRVDALVDAAHGVELARTRSELHLDEAAYRGTERLVLRAAVDVVTGF